MQLPNDLSNVQYEHRRIALYLRLSTEEQSRSQGDPLGRQRFNLDRAAMGIGPIDEDRVYVDLQSGRKEARPHFQSLLRLIEANSIDAVLCDRIDRIGRDLETLTKVWKLFEKTGVHLYLCEWGSFVDFSPYSGGGDWDRFISASTAAEKESRTKAFRSKSTHDYKNFQRKANYRAPYGYLRTAEGQYELDPAVIGDARACISIYLGSRSLNDAVTKIFEQTGKEWTPAGLRRWLANPVLRGHTPRGTRKEGKPHSEVQQDTHPEQAILSEAQYQEIESRIKRRNCSKKGTETATLAGICKCGRCGRNMQTTKWTGKKKTNYYLQCSARRMKNQHSPCSRLKRGEFKAAKYEVVENAVIDALISHAKELAEKTAAPPPEISAKDKEIIDQIESLERMGKQLKDPDFFKPKILELTRQLSPKKIEVDVAKVEALAKIYRRKGAQGFLKSLAPKDRRIIFLEFVKEVVISGMGEVEKIVLWV